MSTPGPAGAAPRWTRPVRRTTGTSASAAAAAGPTRRTAGRGSGARGGPPTTPRSPGRWSVPGAASPAGEARAALVGERGESLGRIARGEAVERVALAFEPPAGLR